MQESVKASAGAEALAPDGVFHQSSAGFVPRVAQQEMAAAVEEALTYGGSLVVESGTGTGKTYAYLVPIVLSGRRTIVSTGTKHLQDQIFNHDLPRVREALGRPVDAVLLKGRANYLCWHRLKQHTQQSDLVGKAETRSFDLIAQWAETTQTGDISEVTDISEESPLWKQATSTADNCLGKDCPDFKQCFVFQARKRAMKADIVVVNHHLFFSDLNLKADGAGELLPAHDAVVFDEAHGLAEIASNFFGFMVTNGQIADLERDTAESEQTDKSGVDFSAGRLALKETLKNLHGAGKKFVGQSVDFDTLQSARFDRACQEFLAALDVYETALAAAAPAGDNLRRCHERCLLIQAHLDTWLSGGDRNLIRWAEIGERRFRFHGTPLQISQRFEEMMAPGERSPATWIFTSATLAVGDDFSAFCNRLGLQNASTRRWDSPYDFEKNALLFLPPDMPEPRQPGYDDALATVIVEVLNASRGRAFCLFTSYEMMNRMYRRLSDNRDWTILLQGQMPKRELLKRFSEHDGGQGGAVLFGTSSFWEGVDVVGEHLSCVIIDKLPFSPPDDPVLKNRLRACEEEGNNPFMDIQLPPAVIALKQGAGRLIRSETDRGVLVLCDPRVSSKGYGRLFLSSLPGMKRTRAINDVRRFFANGK